MTAKKSYFLLALILIVYVIAAFQFFNWVIDDLYIYFRYANNFTNGGGIAFNQGEHVEGFSSFTWFIVLSIYNFISLPLETASKITGVLLSVINLILVFRICTIEKGFAAGITACILTMLNLPFVLWSVSGFEIPLYIFFLLLCFHYVFGMKASTNSFVILSALLFLISISRPEGILFSAAFLIFTFKVTKDKSFTLKASVLFVLLLTSFLIFRLAYFGDLVQNTYYAKIGHNLIGNYELRSYKNGFFYIAYFFIDNPQFFALPLLIILCRKTIFKNDVFQSGLILVLLQFLFTMFSGGDWMVQHRFMTPAIPFMSICIAIALKQYIDSPRAIPVFKYFAVFSIPVIAAASFALSDFKTINKETVLWNNVKNISGKLKELIKPDELTAIGSSGIIPYYLNNVRFIDMVGLTNKYIARNGYRRGTWFERSLPGYVYSQNPKWLIMWKRKNDSGIYTFSKASPCYLDMALNNNFEKYSLQTYFDVYDGDRIEVYKLNEN